MPESRTCSNGVLSGSHTYPACQAAPAAPTSVQVLLDAPGTGQASVNWVPSASSGSSALVGYSVTGGGSGCTAGPSDASCVVSGLAYGTAYSFAVTAANAEGTTATSDPSDSVIPLDAQAIAFANPGPQRFGATPALSATGGASGEPVTFTAIPPGVCAVTSDGLLTFASAGNCTVTAHQAGAAAYAAAPSVPQTFAVNAVAPGAPAAVTAAPSGPSQATVSWTPPANDGGGMTQYTVRALMAGQPSGQTCTATHPVTSCTVTGLAPGVTYTFDVKASNGAGNAASPAPSNPATPLADAKAFSAPSPTGTGPVGVTVAGGGATCAFESVQFVSAASAGAPATRNFPHGVVDFVLHACDTTPVTVTVTYPGTRPQGAQYWKRQGGTWAPFAGAVLGANTAVLTLTDGGTGDDDGMPTPNGRIVDPGGMSVPAAAGGGTPIPTLGEWALALLAALLGLLAWPRRRHA